MCCFYLYFLLDYYAIKIFKRKSFKKVGGNVKHNTVTSSEAAMET